MSLSEVKVNFKGQEVASHMIEDRLFQAEGLTRRNNKNKCRKARFLPD
jgi:hypothetical protein